MATKKTDNTKLVSILSYFLIGIIWYFVDEKIKKDKTAKFHVKQALNLFIISIILKIIFIVVGWVITFFLLMPLFMIIYIALILIWIIGIINALNGSKKEVPIVGSLAEKYLTF